jgi:hypothetical protein
MTGKRSGSRVDWRDQRPADEAVARRMEDPAWGELTDRITAADRDWFRANPHRKCRIRPLREGEQPLLEAPVNPHVIVFKVRDDIRLRAHVELTALIPDDDAVLWRIFRHTLRTHQPELWRGLALMRDLQAKGETP